jgi:hypothetical protein
MKRRRLLVPLFALLALGLATQAASAAPVAITPGTVWHDTSGNVIQAHGEGIIEVGSTFYWLGEDKTNGSPFQNIKCYSSTDLKNWTFVSNVLTRQSSGDLGPNRIVERPHVIFNAATSTYVMYMHIDNTSYSERKAGVATSSSVCGAYSYHGSFKPLGHDSRDDSVFLDGSTGYFMSEDATDSALQIYRLSSDFQTVSALVNTLPWHEAPAMVKIGSTYYLFGSHLTGWSTNDNQYVTATSITGTWSSFRSFAPSGTNTCNSQTTSILPVSGSSGTSYIFLGDRWNASNLADSRYVWEPLTISGTTVSMTCQTSWTIDTATGATGGTSGSGTTGAIVAGDNSAKCVDLNGGNPTNGNKVEMWDCNGNASSQSWTVASNGTLTIDGGCLDITGANFNNGTKIEWWPCNGGANQQWLVQNGTLVNPASGKCLDDPGFNTANGTQLDLGTCNGGSNQQWHLP